MASALAPALSTVPVALMPQLASFSGLKAMPALFTKRKAVAVARRTTDPPLTRRGVGAPLMMSKEFPTLTSVLDMELNLVVKGAAITVPLLGSILESLDGSDCRIAIGIKNHTQYTLTSPAVFLRSGKGTSELPEEVPPEEGLVFTSTRDDNFAQGTVGVLSYFIPEVEQSLFVMWCVPYETVTQNIWFNVWIGEVTDQANDDYYEALYYAKYGKPYPKKAGQDEEFEYGQFNVKANMENSQQSTLVIELEQT